MTFLLIAALLSQAQQPPPSFRTRIDVVRLDVTVLDASRRPVMDLRQADFTILVDGRPQPIAAFEPVKIPPPLSPTSEWMRDVAPDVRSNALGEPRLFVLLMDDATTPTSPYMVDNGRKIANRLIDDMSPSDVAAVVFTMDNSHAQDFTSDHGLLRAAVNRFGSGMSGNPLASKYSQRTLGEVVTRLRERAHGRSAVILISANPVGSHEVTEIAFDTPLSAAAQALSDMRAVAEDVGSIGGAARFTSVPIYGFNIAGLVAPQSDMARTAPGISRLEPPYTDESMRIANGVFQTLADMTGGRAIVRDNDPARQVPAVLDEMSAYYTIAYRATYPVDDGKAHRVQIRVNRAGATVLPSERVLTSERPRKSPKTAPSPLLKAIADLVPTSELPMAVSLAPFALDSSGASKGPKSGVLATVRLRRVAPPERLRDDIQVLASVFTTEGKQLSSVRQTVALKLRPVDGDAQLDILTVIPLEPGRYNIRLSAHSAGLDKTGSVFADTTVPRFDKDRLSLSGVLLSAAPAPIAAPKDAFAKIVPVVPTTERDFTSADRASAFLRVYQRGKTPAPVDVAIRVVDQHGKDVATKTERVDADRFVAGSADISCDLPLSTLSLGSYLLRITATLDPRTSAERDVRFTVR